MRTLCAPLKPTRAGFIGLMLIVLVATGMASAARAQAVEPVFDSTYDTRLGNILRIKTATTHSDYAAMESAAASARAGDVTARHVMGQLGRLRAEIGSAPPLRWVDLNSNFGEAGVNKYYFDRASDQKWIRFEARFVPHGLYDWSYQGRGSTQVICNNSSLVDPGIPFHRLRVFNGPCEVELMESYEEIEGVGEIRGTYLYAVGTRVAYPGCAYYPEPYVLEGSYCISAFVDSAKLWELINVGNAEPATTQDIDVIAPYSQWPFASAPHDQTDALSEGRTLLGTAPYRDVRAWLNSLLDPTNYRSPISLGQTFGVCDRVPTIDLTDSNACQQVIR